MAAHSSIWPKYFHKDNFPKGALEGVKGGGLNSPMYLVITERCVVSTVPPYSSPF